MRGCLEAQIILVKEGKFTREMNNNKHVRIHLVYAESFQKANFGI